MILCKEKYAKIIDKAIFPGTQGGPLMHVIAAKAVCFGEAIKPEFNEYQQQILRNAQALAGGLIEEGFNLVSGGTDNHLMLVDLRNKGITGKEAEKNLDKVRITVNKNTIPNDPESPFVTSGIRLGTPAVTTRGMKEEDMREIARAISLAISDFDRNKEQVLSMVDSLCKRYPLYSEGIFK
jgi:glycine hydroxymethyltransferase